jgi:hypothetical protein
MWSKRPGAALLVEFRRPCWSSRSGRCSGRSRGIPKLGLWAWLELRRRRRVAASALGDGGRGLPCAGEQQLDGNQLMARGASSREVLGRRRAAQMTREATGLGSSAWVAAMAGRRQPGGVVRRARLLARAWAHL